MRKHRLAALVATVLVAGTLAACSPGGGSASTESTLTVASTTPPNSLDPAQSANGTPARWFVDPTYASILQLDPDTGEVIAGLADEWEYVGDDNTGFTFRLRDGLTFADGTPLGAEQAIASFEYFNSIGTGPTKALFAGWTFEATDERTVSITTPAPVPIIPTLLTPDYLFGAVISPAGLAEPEKLQAESFGAGPYVLDTEATVAGDHYTYVRNENYYDAESVEYDSIVGRIIPNLTQQVQALKTGQVQVIQADSTVADTVTGGAIEILQRPANWSGLYLFDRQGTLVPALADLRVREALNLAVNREEITEAVYGEYGEATSQTALPGAEDAGYVEELDDYYEYDVDRAKELLAEAGYADGFSMPVFYQTYVPAEAKLAQVLADQLAAVGVTLELKGEPNFSAWVTDLFAKQFAGTVFTGGGPSAYQSVQWFLPNGALNPFAVSVPEIDAAYAELAAASTPEEQAEKSTAVTEAVLAAAPAVVVARLDLLFGVDGAKVDGVRFIGETAEMSSITTWSPK